MLSHVSHASWSVHGACMQNGCTPLTLASLRGRHETVEVLLKHGADANVKDKIVSAQGELR